MYVRSVDKWTAENDKELETTTWLKYDIVNCEQVDCLKCSVCTKFNDQLVGMKNYSSAYIDGSRNLKASSFKDHAHTSMHKKAMNLYKKHQGRDLIEYSPLARALATMDSATREVMAKKI